MKKIYLILVSIFLFVDCSSDASPPNVEQQDTGLSDIEIADIQRDVGIDNNNDVEIADIQRDVGIDNNNDVEIPSYVGIMSPQDGLITNTSIITVVVTRNSGWNPFLEEGECDIIPMSIFANNNQEGITYCGGDAPDRYFGCTRIYAEISLDEGENIIEANIPIKIRGNGNGRIYVHHQSITITYDRTHSTTNQTLIYTNTYPCPLYMNNGRGLINNRKEDIIIIDPETHTGFGKIKTTVGQGEPGQKPWEIYSGLHLSPDSRTLYFVGRNGIHYISTDDHQIIKTINLEDFLPGPIIKSVLYHSEIFLITKDRDNNRERVYIFNAETDNIEGNFIPTGGIGLGNCARLAFHPTELKMYFTAKEYGTGVYNTGTYEFIHRLRGSEDNPVQVHCWSCHKWIGIHPSGNWGILLGNSSNQGYLNIFDAQTDIFTDSIRTPNNNDCYPPMAFSSSANIAYIHGARSIFAYNHDNGEILWNNGPVNGPIYIFSSRNLYALYHDGDAFDKAIHLVELDSLNGNLLNYLWGGLRASTSLVYKSAH